MLERELVLDGEVDLSFTLSTFLAANLSPSQIAHELYIHRHTIAYRLDKIAQLTGFDPRAFDAAAYLSAALLLRKLDGTTTGDVR